MDDQQRLIELCKKHPQLASVFRGAAETITQAVEQRDTALETFDQIDSVGFEAGQEVARLFTSLETRQQVEQSPREYACPACGKICEAKPDKRTIQGRGGPVSVPEWKCHCSSCRRVFFPLASEMET